jgi:hypothetical protein
MRVLSFAIVLLLAGPVALAENVSQCFLKSAGGFEGHERLIVTESDGGFLDVQNPNHVMPTVMIRGTYTRPGNVDQNLDLSEWFQILEPRSVTGLTVRYVGDPDNRSLSGVVIKINAQTFVYGDCKLIRDWE